MAGGRASADRAEWQMFGHPVDGLRPSVNSIRLDVKTFNVAQSTIHKEFLFFLVQCA